MYMFEDKATIVAIWGDTKLNANLSDEQVKQ